MKEVVAGVEGLKENVIGVEGMIVSVTEVLLSLVVSEFVGLLGVEGKIDGGGDFFEEC